MVSEVRLRQSKGAVSSLSSLRYGAGRQSGRFVCDRVYASGVRPGAPPKVNPAAGVDLLHAIAHGAEQHVGAR
jgi:hypothetical protein